MGKDVYYFSHDANAHNDPKIIRLRRVHGWEGYGLYWAIIEMLRCEEGYRMRTQYDDYAFALRSDANVIKSIVEDFNLFEVDSEVFYSESLLRRMMLKDEKSKKARNSARIRWAKNEENANAMRTHSERNARKGKERKEKERNSYESFDSFYKHYPKKKNRRAAERAFKKLKVDKELLEKMLSALEEQKNSKEWLRDDGQFIPYPASWLNGRRWEDETESDGDDGWI